MGFDYFLLSLQWRSLSHYLAPSQDAGSPSVLYIKSVSIFCLFHWHWGWDLSNLSVSSAFSIDIEVETYQLCCCQPCEATIISYLAHYSESPSPTGASLMPLLVFLRLSSLTASREILSLLCSKPTYLQYIRGLDQFSLVQSLSHVWLFATTYTAARQASLSISNSQSLLKFMSNELVMPSKRLILCHPLLLLPSIFPIIRVFSNKSVLHIRWLNYWSKFQLQHQSFQWIFRTDFL